MEYKWLWENKRHSENMQCAPESLLTADESWIIFLFNEENVKKTFQQWNKLWQSWLGMKSTIS